MLDCSGLTFGQMADIIRAIWMETKRRNPIGVNFYSGYLKDAMSALQEIHDGELDNPTCECGPGTDEA